MQKALGWARAVVTLQVAVVGLGLIGCGSQRPITVTPTLAPYDCLEIPCPHTKAKFFLDEVVDKRGYSDPSNIGFTQTGLFNVKASLLTEPPPTTLLEHSISGLLKQCDNLAREEGDAQFLLHVALANLQLTEVTGWWSETLTASLNYDSQVFAASSNTRWGRFSVAARSSRDDLDTTPYAREVVVESLQESLADFSRELGEFQ